MIQRCLLTLIPGLLLVLTTAIPNIAFAQKSNSSVADNLAAAKELSAVSGRPILAVAGSAT